uniref:Putative polyprotein n=1 Tax=Albugo laibachii Nc14 TaxID=890382 RepID=F0X2C2_9STRA|nr:putative polyprotein [Albugo laibachii Nc14]|eukprot:CCA28006.1 putative polyprotein [Albugo laibachii Nc14]
MLQYKVVSTEFCTENVNTAVYLINRSSNTTHMDLSSCELSIKLKPRMDHLRVFGSEGYAHINGMKRTELEPKRFRFVFLGHAASVEGYRLFDLNASKVKVSR